jgi:molybdopterin-guanine dinucleotide biosynthesis protein A
MSNLIKNCTGVILAGGENRRMPVTKAFIRIGGKRIIERNVKIMETLFQEVLIVTNSPELYVYLGIPLLGDVYPVRGPMTGVLTALLNASQQWIFTSACDMPRINADLIRYMAAKRGGYEAVVPRPLNRAEPLFTFYSKRLIRHMERAIHAGTTGLQDFLRNKKVKYIPNPELKKIDTRLRSFINLNTPEDIRLFLRSEGIQLN